MGGRDNKWKSHIEPRLATIKAWKAKGLTDIEIAANLGVSLTTFKEQKKKHSSFSAALKTGKSDANAQVENALFKRAIGYEYEETEQYETLGPQGVSTRIKMTTKFIAPDVVAQIFYLKNRCYADWHDRKQMELTGAEGKPLMPSNVHIILPDNGMDAGDKKD